MYAMIKNIFSTINTTQNKFPTSNQVETEYDWMDCASHRNPKVLVFHFTISVSTSGIILERQGRIKRGKETVKKRQEEYNQKGTRRRRYL